MAAAMPERRGVRASEEGTYREQAAVVLTVAHIIHQRVLPPVCVPVCLVYMFLYML